MLLVTDMINKMRTRFGMSQEVIAKILGVNSMTVSKWSCDHDYPNRDNEDNIRILYSMLVKGKGIREELIVKKKRSEDIFDIGERVYPKNKRR